MSAIANTSDKASIKQRLFRARPEDVLPIKIQHQRIYILPTRRGLAYLFSLLIMLIASVNYALSLGYALCFLLVGLFGASLLHTYRNLAGLSFESINTNNVFAGEDIEFKIRLSNSSSLSRVGVEIKANNASSVVNVASSNNTLATLLIPTQQRGIQSLGRVTATSTYPLGLWRTWSYIHSNAVGIVYPVPEISPPPLPANSSLENGENQRQSMQGDIAGVREYHTGDSISSIAWKAAARGQGLFVKTFEEDKSGGESHLCLSATGLTDTEEQLSRLTAWAIAAEQSQVDYSFELSETNLELASGPTHKQNALMAMATYGLSS